MIPQISIFCPKKQSEKRNSMVFPKKDDVNHGGKKFLRYLEINENVSSCR